MPASVGRRDVLQGGVLAGGLAIAGLRPRPGLAASEPGNAVRLSGMIAAHIRVDFVQGASIRLVQLDRTQRPVRELDAARMSLAELYDAGIPSAAGNPLRRVCDRAQAMAVRSTAGYWRVPPEACVACAEGIVHAASGRAIGYKAWVDVV
jgi:hypothetical protein